MKIYQFESKHPMNSNIVLPFKEIYTLENRKSQQEAFITTQILANAIEGDGELNVDKVMMIAKYNANLVISKVMNKLIVQAYSPITEIVDRIYSLVKTSLNVVLSKQEQFLIKQKIYEIFTNLYEQKQASWIFYQACSSRLTAYKYNLIFAVQNPFTNDSVHLLSMSLTVKIFRSSENILYLDKNDSISSSVKISCLKLIQNVSEIMNNKLSI